MPKQKIEELGSLSKSEKVRLNRLYSRGRAAYGSIQNLSKASGLSKKKVEKFLQTKTSYTKIGPPISSFRRLQAFSNYINEIWCMDLAFVEKLASQNNGVKYLLVAVDIFFEICQSSNNENKVCQRHFTNFTRFLEKTLLKNFGLIKEQNMGELLKSFARRKTLKFTQQ